MTPSLPPIGGDRPGRQRPATDVPVVDNQLVKKGQVLFVVDRPRYEQALAEAGADVAYYQALAAENGVRPAAA